MESLKIAFVIRPILAIMADKSPHRIEVAVARYSFLWDSYRLVVHHERPGGVGGYYVLHGVGTLRLKVPY